MTRPVRKNGENVLNYEHDSEPVAKVKPRSFGERLREERLRIGMTQTEMAEIGGVKRTTQHIYETDIRTPDLTYLMRVRDAGADLSYLVLGCREGPQGADFLTLSRGALSNIYRLVDEVCVDAEGRLLPLEARLRVFQLLCATVKGQDASASSLEAMREEFARFTGT